MCGSDSIASMYPVIAEFGPLRIYSFGLMMALGFLAATFLGTREFNRRGYDGEIASTLVVWAAIGGIVGARIWAIAGDWDGFLSNPTGSLLSGAGFTWYGGLIGGALAVTIALRRHSVPWTVGADCIAPGLLIGHALGRIGCQLAGDGDWGTVTTLPWGMAYPNAIIGWDYPPGVVVHPAPLYEAAAYSIGFLIVWSLRLRDYPSGTLFWLFLVLSPGARFFIEFVRINPPLLFGLTESQLTSIALVVIGATQLYRTAAFSEGRAGARATA